MYEILAEDPARRERFGRFFANPDKTADGFSTTTHGQTKPAW